MTAKQQLKDIETLLKSKADELGISVDFSDKGYDGDLECPMDAYGFLEFILTHVNYKRPSHLSPKRDPRDRPIIRLPKKID